MEDYIILNLTREEVCTILTALKMEAYRYEREGQKDRLAYVNAAVSAISTQPWKINGRNYSEGGRADV